MAKVKQPEWPFWAFLAGMGILCMVDYILVLLVS